MILINSEIKQPCDCRICQGVLKVNLREKIKQAAWSKKKINPPVDSLVPAEQWWAKI
jgi:hypothetical protein